MFQCSAIVYTKFVDKFTNAYFRISGEFSPPTPVHKQIEIIQIFRLIILKTFTWIGKLIYYPAGNDLQTPEFSEGQDAIGIAKTDK